MSPPRATSVAKPARGTRSSADRVRATVAEPVSAADAPCSCGVGRANGEGRKAIAVDPDIKARNLTRLRRIEGQVRGLQRMVEEDRYCADIMTQISSVHEALRSVGRALMRNHLQHCASSAIRSSPEDAERMYDELVALMYTSAR
jgi:DNA-binding FrmR family transcriptional regulator